MTTKKNIYEKVLDELEKKYIFTRNGLERRYNNMLKLKQQASDDKLIELIKELLEQYDKLTPGDCDIDIDKYQIPSFSFSPTIDIVANINSKICRENLRVYCNKVVSLGMSCGMYGESITDYWINQWKKRDADIFNTEHIDIYSYEAVRDIMKEKHRKETQGIKVLKY